MPAIEQSHVAILATDGFERSELVEPQRQLEEAGARVSILAPDGGEIRSWDETDWGDGFAVDQRVADAKVEEFDALVLPGGQINPDKLRLEQDALEFIRRFFDSGKPLAAICHAPWLLVETGIAKGRKLTSFASIRTDMVNAGAEWEDRPVVCDKALITSRNPNDLDAFCAKLIEEIREGKHERDAAGA